MEKFLENIESKPTPQKIGIGIAIAFVLLAIIGLSTILTQPKQSPEKVTEVSSQSGNQALPQNSQNPLQASPTALPKNYYTYVGNNFQFSYPNGLYSISGNKENGKDHIALNLLDDDSELAHIDIQVSPSSELSDQQIISVFDYYRLSKATAVVDRTQALIFKGVVGVKTPVSHSTVAIFVKNKKTYKIQLSYDGSSENIVWESDFRDLLTNFKTL